MPITDFNKTSSSDAAVSQIEDATSGDTLGITASNEAKVSVTQPLPTGTNNIGSITNVTGTVSLPTGASTSALQTTGNASLASIDSKMNALGQTTMASSMPVVPASDWTERATFTVVGSAIAPAANKSMLAIANLSGSGVIIKIREILIYSVQTGAVTGTMNDFRLYKFTTKSGGTAITTDAHDTNDSLNGSVTAATGATISGEDTRYLRRALWSSDEFGAGTADAETTEHTMAQLLPFYIPSQYTKPVTIRPGQGAHIKQTVSTTAGTFDIVVVFTQEST